MATPKYRKDKRVGENKRDRKSYASSYYMKNKEFIKLQTQAYQKTKVQSLRKEVVEHYGGKCACCGENIFSLLCIDHVNNDGNVTDRTLGGSRISNYRLCLNIIKEGFPDRYQILCYNCNHSKKNNKGICIHKLIKQYE